MKRTIAIIGGGSAALMLAAMLDETKFNVTLYEKNAALGRKFLVAGDGGFNLTHSEDKEQFIQRYTPPQFLEKSLRQFSNTDLRNWLHSIGIETFVGSSKRVFPVKGIKPIDVLNAFLNVLKKKNVQIITNHEWKGWNDIKADITVFALGGASWPVTGSDGSWTKHFLEKGIDIVPFQSSNCAFKVIWKEEFIKETEGQSLKNIAISCGGKEKKGEVVITKYGMEGGAIYALSPQIREQINKTGKAIIHIDMKPGVSAQQIKDKFMQRGNRSIKKLLEDRLSFSDVHVSLLKSILTKEEFTDLALLAEKIKSLPLTISGMAPMEEAISTVGGIALHEVDENFQLKKMPDVYCIGEMLDWDAPTGGYLLQGCFSMGVMLAKKINS
jgi:uncharacterized flavoprotein (TIGR03862 family)